VFTETAHSDDQLAFSIIEVNFSIIDVNISIIDVNFSIIEVNISIGKPVSSISDLQEVCFPRAWCAVYAADREQRLRPAWGNGHDWV
jgi:hypothetical protein